ncbi:MAG: VWA domain-containing protein [Rhizobiales bacterium]|nr:VWA domain-containing protein [Hyphomicrobiales bacterium]
MMFLQTLKEKLTAFKREKRGNVAIIFGLAVVPLMIGAGVAVDYARSVTAKNVMQSAADAAALAAAAMTKASEADRIAMAQNVFDANFSTIKGVKSGNLKVTFPAGGVRVTHEATVDTVLMQLAGIQDIPLKTVTEVNLPTIGKAEIALVLDYSGSMGNMLNGEKKYITMRNAAKQLVSDISESAAEDDVKVGLVPFSHHVYTSLPGEYVLGGKKGTSWTGCTYDRRAPHNVNDTSPISTNNNTKWGNTKSQKKFDDYGCDGYVNNSLYVQPLTTNTASIQSQLDDMTPYAWTNIALGMAFGWHMLSPNAPYVQASEYNDGQTLKAIVLLTDGKQTALSWGPNGKQTQKNGEKNLEKICTNIKSVNDDPDKPRFIIITVAFDLDDEDTVNRLRDCATSNDYFYEAENNGQLSSAFDAITKQISKAIAITK